MSNTKVYFYRVDIYESSTNIKVEYDGERVKKMLDDLKKKKGVLGGKYISVDLSPTTEVTDIKPKETLDFFEDDKYVLGRLCRKKPNNQIINRNYKTLSANSVFNTEEEATHGIEEYSFFLLDTVKGVLLIATKQGAPSQQALTDVADTFGLETKMEFTIIPNHDGIRLLCKSSSPEISRITVEMPVPDAEFLQRVLGMPDGEVMDLVNKNVAQVNLVLKAAPRNPILKGQEVIEKTVSYLLRALPNLNKAVVRGKSNDFSARDFDLKDPFFSYMIDVTKTHMVNGRKVSYSLEEIVDKYRESLRSAYEENKLIISHLIGR